MLKVVYSLKPTRNRTETERLFERSEFSEIEGRILAGWIVQQKMKGAHLKMFFSLLSANFIVFYKLSFTFWQKSVELRDLFSGGCISPAI